MSVQAGPKLAELEAIKANYSLTGEQRQIVDHVDRVSRELLHPLQERMDAEEWWPEDLFKQMGELGLHGITVSEEDGGLGLGYLEHVIAVEEVSRASASVGLSYGVDQPSPIVGWDFPADVAALSGAPVSPPFDLDSEGAIVGASGLDGILWAHAPTLDAAPIASEPADGLRMPEDLASTYDEGDLRYTVSIGFDPFPEYEPAWPWEYCAVCGLLELPFLHLVRDWLVAVGAEQEGLEVSEIVEDGAWVLLGAEDALALPTLLLFGVVTYIVLLEEEED